MNNIKQIANAEQDRAYTASRATIHANGMLMTAPRV